VAVRIVIDSYQFAVAPSRKLPNLDIQHFGWGLSDKPPRRTLVSEFGLAMHVESRRATRRATSWLISVSRRKPFSTRESAWY